MGSPGCGVDPVDVVGFVTVVVFLQLSPILLKFSFPQTVGDAPGSGPRLGQTAQNQVKLNLLFSRSSFLRVGLMI